MSRIYAQDPITGKSYLAYISPGSVRFEPEDTALLFPWLPAMREGVGPAEPGDGYNGGRGHRRRDHAHYEAWCKIAAEYDRRLAKCHEDRLIAERYLYYIETDTKNLLHPQTLAEYDEAINAIARETDRQPGYVKRALQNVLSYISSGQCPRWINCIDCLEYPHCRKRKKLKYPRGISYAEWKGHRRHKK